MSRPVSKNKIADLMAHKFMLDWMRWDLRYSGKQAVCASAWDWIEEAVKDALLGYEELVNRKHPAKQRASLKLYRNWVQNDEAKYAGRYGAKGGRHDN